MISRILFFGFFLTTIVSFGQNINVSGIVSEQATNGPLPGASVVIKNTNTGVTTDFDGNFYLTDVPVNSVLEISFIGFITQEVIVTSNEPISVILSEDTSTLDEVVVIGYGSQKVSKISGAVSSVNKKSIEALAPVRAEDALQGQAAGVTVISNGSPGAKPTVLIRGIPSYTGTDPLVVIDGVTQTLDDLNALNPSDIQSMNVLKDAALTAIYGVSGGNGVIVVKTKGGRRNQKTAYSFDSSYGIQEVTKTIDVLNASEYASILNEASVASGGDLIFNNISGLGKGTNWQDEVIVDAPIINNNFTASGGGETSGYYLSAGYLSQEGVVGGGDKSYFDRLNVTGNFDIDLNEKLKAIVNTSYANIKSAGLSENNIGSVLSNALNFDPMISPYDVNGDFGISNTITQEIKNPLALIDNTYNEGNTNKLFGKIELQYDVLDNLKITSRLGYTYTDVIGKNFTPLQYYGVGHNSTNANEDLSPIETTDGEGVTTSTHNRVSESSTNYFSYTYEIYGNYDFTIKENHNFQTVLGFSIAKNTGSSITANAQDIPFNSWAYADVSAATGDNASQTSSSWQYEKRNLSFFGRINYDYQEKYLVSFTARRDGSTSFGSNNKFAFFPSASLGWVVSNEDFFESNIVSFLKLRGSYGTVGNDNISPQFSTISTFPQYTFDGNIVSGSTLQSIPNDDVTWENQIQSNFGIDLRLWNGKVSLNADYFEKTVDDLLFNPTLSLYLGTPVYPAANIGKTKSTGFDISASYNDSFGEDFNFSTSVNFTTVKNNVEEINNGDKFIWGSGYGIPYTQLTRFEEGFSPGYFYGYKTNGIFQNQAEIDAHATQEGAQPGDIRYADIDGNGVIDAEDRTEIGDPFPDFTIGWNIGFDYKNFDFNMFTYASVGGDLYRAYERNLNFTNRSASTLDRWTGEGTSNTEPRVTFIDTNNNRRASDRYVEDGSFVRIKNIQLGYTLPEIASDKISISKIRIYGQVKNAFTFTDYSGYDPEISSGVLDTGIDRGSYPQPRVWLMGLNVQF
ncbi:MAG: TonB-dependent receptor [Urechidicola sp.]|nr:TonB-dependent receptor [Urechidicola sp.]